MSFLPKVEEKINECITGFNEISPDRKNILTDFADYISDKLRNGNEVNLIFICTHNSRRSHMAQIWAQTAAAFYRIPKVHCYSGGTEATAFHRNAIKAVEKAGFKIETVDKSPNSVYRVSYSENDDPIKCFSKVYSDSFNPQNNFAAVMTCSEADENCPVVFGADARFPLRYDDPKEFDGTEIESQKYTERFEQIGREMLFAFSKVGH